MPKVPASQAKPKLEKAYIILLPPSVPGMGNTAMLGAAAGAAGGGKAASGGGSGGAGGMGQLVFRFNPKEYTIQKSASWQRRPMPGVLNATVPEFTGAEPRELSLEIFLDGTETPTRKVAADVELLFSCCTPTIQSLLMRQPSPPFVIFGWGTTMSFLAFVKSVSAKYTLFKQDGTPLRAVCQVTLEEIPTPIPKQNPTSGALTSQRTTVVTAGDTLQSIAYREYRNPNLWRAIAEANDIDDPLRLPSGTQLLLPAPPDAAEADELARLQPL